MEVKDKILKTKDGYDIFYQTWTPKNKPKAVIQICHGLAEHIGAYDEFAQFLSSKDIFIIGNDHRGHGKNITTDDNRGIFATADGWAKSLADLKDITNIAREQYSDIPIFLFGHSMGSFFTRSYIQTSTKHLSGAVICGTGGFPGAIGNIGILISKIISKLYGPTHKSKLLDSMSFGSYNNQFKPNRTSFDWLSRDDEKVDSYINDPLKGHISSSQLFVDMLSAVKEIDTLDNLRNTNKEFPLYIISGYKDPVGNNGDYIKKLYNQYIENGFTNVSMKLYPNCRHEILNEINRKEVMSDVYQWINNLL